MTRVNHGLSGTRIYRIYHDMHRRCERPQTEGYKWYGIRGITVCPEWSGSDGFIHFYEWSMKNGYEEHLSIDRIDHDGNYEPSNCRWTDAVTQANNTRWNTVIEYEGESHSIADWARITGIADKNISNRIRMGWSVGEALGYVYRKQKRHDEVLYTINGETHNVAEWCRITGISKNTVRYRRDRGWSSEEIFGFKERKMGKFNLTEQNYYSQAANKVYCSASQYLSFVGRPSVPGCEARAMAEINGEYKQEITKAMLIGSILDALWEGATTDELVDQFPDCVSTRGATKGQIKFEYQQAIQLYERSAKDEMFRKYMSGEHQTIMIGKIEGLPFKIKMDSYHPGVAIVDLKTTQNSHPMYRYYDKMTGRRLPFYLWWSYDTQLAIYREIVRQNTGDTLPCFIAAIDKNSHPRPEIIQLDDALLDDAIEEVKRNCKKIIMLKNKVLDPIRCESDDCDYCRDTYVCKGITSSEFETMDDKGGEDAI